MVAPRFCLGVVTNRKVSVNAGNLPLYSGRFIESSTTVPNKDTFIMILNRVHNWRENRDSSVGIAQGYGLDDRGSRVRLSAGAGNFLLHHRVQTSSGAHPASYPMGTRGSFPGGKAAGA
jgi:hypothetical protein